MHHSRLAGFIIDCQTDDVNEAASFWSQALGYQSEVPTGADESDYVYINTPDDEVHIEVQKVSHASRVHLDIETDDIDAEVARLEALGAKKISYVKRWCVMEAPTGQRFCVVRPQRQDFAEKANRWD